MNNDIKLRSRYGDFHTLQHMPEEGDNVYRYVPAQEWMPMYYTFEKAYDENADVNELVAVDTDGGPFLGIGDEVEGKTVKRVYNKKGVGCLLELE